jgi:hypothetical protein
MDFGFEHIRTDLIGIFQLYSRMEKRLTGVLKKFSRRGDKPLNLELGQTASFTSLMQ